MKSSALLKGALAASLLLAAPLAAQDAPADVSTLVPDDAIFAFWTNNYPEMKTSMAKTPYGKLLNDPASDRLREFIMAKIEESLKEDQGEEDAEKLKAFLASWKGAVGAFGVQVPGTKLDDLKGVFFVQLDDKGKAWVKENIDPLKDATDVKKDSYKISDVEVFRMSGSVPVEDEEIAPEFPVEAEEPATEGEAVPAEKTPTPTPAPKLETETYQYAYVDDFFIYTDVADEAAMKNVIGAFKKAEGTRSIKTGTLSGLPAFSTAKPGDVGMVLNLDAMSREWITSLAADQLGPDQPNPAAIAEAAGLFDFKKMAANFSGSDGGFFGKVYTTTTTEKHGLVAAYLQGPTTKLDMLKYAPADTISVTSFSADLGAIYDSVMKITEMINPGLPALLNMQVLGIQSQYQVDPINSILKNISGEHLMVQREMDPELVNRQKAVLEASGDNFAAMNVENASKAFFLGLRNGDETAKSLRTLLENLRKDPSMAEMIEVAEEEGVTTVRIKSEGADQAPIQPAFAFSSQAIVIANNQLEIQNAVRALTGKLPEKLADQASVQGAMKRADKQGLLFFGYNSSESVAKAMEQARTMLEATLEEEDEFDPSMIPSAEVAEKYFGPSFSALNVKDGYLVLDWQAVPPGVLDKAAPPAE